MKKISIIIVACVFLSYCLSASAQNNTSSLSGSHAGGYTTGSVSGSNGGLNTISNPLPGVKSLGDLVKTGVQIFSYIAVLLGVFMLVVVGLRYILARGNAEKMKEASMWLLYISIGIAIVIGASIAVNIIINTLAATNVVDPKVLQNARDALK